MRQTVTFPDPTRSLAAVAAEVGERFAGPAADDVDTAGRFPSEAFAAVRESGLLGALVPLEYGGPGCSMTEFAGAVTALAEHCASSGLILAMHGIQVACIVRHGSHETLERVLPALISGELLLANANSEVGLYGDRRNSICALEATPDGYRLEKRASCVSYGESADGILATARRTPDSPPNEQVMAICLPPSLKVERTGDWNTLGLRATQSVPCLLSAEITPDLLLEDYGEVFAQTSLPASAILLSSVWLGISEAAARRAHITVRSQARKLRAADPGALPPPSALRLAELTVTLHQARAMIAYGAAEYERAKDTTEVATIGFSALMDSVKLSSSTLVGDIVRKAMGICGMAGFANDTPTSLARLARDAAAAPLMVNNERALVAASHALLLRKDL
jgi:acyl-CoA dehydrogenase